MLSGKKSASEAGAAGGPGFTPWVGMIPWKRAWHPLQYAHLENPRGQRSLVGYSPLGRTETQLKRLSTPAHKYNFISEKEWVRE